MACAVCLLSVRQNKGNHFLFQVTRLKRKPQQLLSWLDVQAAFFFPPTTVMTFCVLEYLGSLDNSVMGKSYSNPLSFSKVVLSLNFSALFSLAVKKSEKERKVGRKQE